MIIIITKLTDICSGYIYFLNFKEGEEKKVIIAMWRYIGHILYIRSNNNKNDNNNNNTNTNNNNNKNKCAETQKKWFKPILLIVTSHI